MRQLFNRLATFSGKYYSYNLRRYSFTIALAFMTVVGLLLNSVLPWPQTVKAQNQPSQMVAQTLPSSTLSLVVALNIFPSAAIQGQKLWGSYTLQNTSKQALTLPMLLIGARDPNDINVDFPVVSNIKLEPGQKYTYYQATTLSKLGNYTAWPAAYFNNSWVELGPRISFNVSTCNPTYGNFGSGKWPPACWRPYANSSPFNTPLPAAPAIAQNSDKIVARVLGDISAIKRPEHLIAKADGTGGEPTYYSQPSDPQYTLRCSMTRWGNCPLEGRKIRIPRGAQVEGNRAAKETNSDAYFNEPDAHLTVVDQAAGLEYDLWQVHDRAVIRPEDGSELRFSWGGYTHINGNGLGSNATAATFGSLAGRIRAEELKAGQINHALFIVIDCDSGKFVFPAAGVGQSCSRVGKANTNAPPMGTRFQLAMSPREIEALPIQKWKKTILHAMAKYGMFFGDTGTRGLFALSPEAGNQYTSIGSYTNKWFDFGMRNWEAYTPEDGILEYVGKLYNTSDDPDPQFDWISKVWRNLRVIAPCVTKGTCS